MFISYRVTCLNKIITPSLTTDSHRHVRSSSWQSPFSVFVKCFRGSLIFCTIIRIPVGWTMERIRSGVCRISTNLESENVAQQHCTHNWLNIQILCRQSTKNYSSGAALLEVSYVDVMRVQFVILSLISFVLSPIFLSVMSSTVMSYANLGASFSGFMELRCDCFVADIGITALPQLPWQYVTSSLLDSKHFLRVLDLYDFSKLFI